MSQPWTRWEWVNSQKRRDLPDARLADHGDDLAVPGLGPLQGLTELLQLAVAADETGQPPRGGGLEPRSAPTRRRPARRPRSAPASPFTGTGPSERHLDVALGQLAASPAVSRMLPGVASCSMRAARWVVWPTAV